MTERNYQRWQYLTGRLRDYHQARVKKLNAKLHASWQYSARRRKMHDLLAPNGEYKDRYKGKRCFIVGNGPSLKKQDLSKLADEYVFTVNYAHRLAQFDAIRSNFHLLMDDKLFDDGGASAQEILRRLDPAQTTLFLLAPESGEPVPAALTGDLTVRYLASAGNVIDDEPWQYDPTEALTATANVVHTAALLAVYMGFTEIYFLGCDCTGIVPNIQSVERRDKIEGYAYEVSEKEKQANIKAYAEHRISMYETFYGWAKVFYGYRRLHELEKSNGVHFYNATGGGILDELETADYDSLFA